MNETDLLQALLDCQQDTRVLLWWLLVGTSFLLGALLGVVSGPRFRK